MTDDALGLARRYARRGVLVDSNLLLLLFIGELDRDLIPSWKRTEKYQPADFAVLSAYLGQFHLHVTTPNVLTEVSNLAKDLGFRAEAFFRVVFRPAVTVLWEAHVRSCEAVAQPSFPRFGLTDTCLVRLARHRYLVLTDDWPLSQFIGSQGGAVLNFNHLRPLALR